MTRTARRTLSSAIACAAISTAAVADVTVPFVNITMAGFQFNQVFSPGSLAGNLTGVSVNATLNASTNFTYADDLCVYFDVLPLSTGGLVQVGGYSDLSTSQRYFWANGGSDAPGTVVNSTVTFISPLSMAIPDLAVYLGNGYGAGGTSGTWTGSITLIGVTRVENCIRYRDLDGDGFGSAASGVAQSCSTLAGYVANNDDCNDNNAAINPDTSWYRDTDNDGHGVASEGIVHQCTQPSGYALLNGDNCPSIANPDQADINSNSVGDACELARGDLNLDGLVNGLDFAFLLGKWGWVGPSVEDLNHDGIVNGSDIPVLMNSWGSAL
jgi:hypothetical protein